MTTAAGIIIDPEFQQLVPALTDQERAQLEANLVAEGCREALVVWGQDVQAITNWIDKLTEPGDLVVDPFCGGGTVPMACLATKRRWIATEIDASKAAVARKRIRDGAAA